jgi:hypothetical protein
MISEIRILPPLAIARLGSSPTPLANYDLTLPRNPIGYRKICPAETLIVDPDSGEISAAVVPKKIEFRDGDRIRPVAPFFEVFASIDKGGLEPLTVEVLKRYGLSEADVRWSVRAGNLKVFRRTGIKEDRVYAEVDSVSDHASHKLEGKCGNFVTPDSVLPLGSVRYIRPNEAFPEIRLRFTPAEGKVYGSSLKRKTLDLSGNIVEEHDPVISADHLIYDSSPGRGTWRDWVDPGLPSDTNPGQIYAGFSNAQMNQQSWGYLDDECDGVVRVELAAGGKTLSAFARFGAGPPAFAPDGLPVRTAADELEQAVFGPEVDSASATLEDAEDILRRAFETVRLLNTAVMNGNTINGRTAVASMMPSQDSNDTSRLFAPIMATTVVDNLAIVALHQGVFAALRSGTRPWFLDVLRRPEEVGDLTDVGRRKMPAMMRGADGRYLTLTRRQIDTIRKAAQNAASGLEKREENK